MDPTDKMEEDSNTHIASFFASSQAPASQPSTKSNMPQNSQDQEDDVVDEDVVDIDDSMDASAPNIELQNRRLDGASDSEPKEEDETIKHTSSSKSGKRSLGSNTRENEDGEMDVTDMDDNVNIIADDDTALGNHDDMWESVEVDSEFEGLSDEEEYLEYERRMDEIDEKMEGTYEADARSGDPQMAHARHHRHHHFSSSQATHEANRAMVDAVASYVGKNAMRSAADDDDDDVTDEEEAAYETQVQRYNQYQRMNETHGSIAAMDIDSDETEDEDDDFHLNRPARTRRSRKASAHTQSLDSARSRSSKSTNIPKPKSPAASSSAIPRGPNQRNTRPSQSHHHHHHQMSEDDGEDDDGDDDGSEYSYLSGPANRLRARRHHPEVEAETDLEKIKVIVAKEFETAVISKRKEFETIEANIEATKQIWERLQNLWMSRTWSDSMMAARVQAAAALRNSKKRGRPMKRPHLNTTKQLQEDASAALSRITKDLDEPAPKRRKRGEAPVPRPLYCLTPTKGFVQVVCPDCGRDLFGNHLGFINHCRLVHLTKFASWDDAVELCGRPVDESVVPLDDPCRTESTIGYRISQQRSEAAARYGQQLGTGGHSQPPQTISHLPSSTNSFPPTSSSSSALTVNGKPPYGNSTTHSFQAVSQGAASKRLSSAGIPQALETSRFYIKKQVIIGNTYKYIANALPDPSTEALSAFIRPQNDTPTHRWMVYLRPIGDEDLTKFISKVRFFLNPAFKPRHVVEITKPPFQLIRESSQEWPVRLQVFFNDPRNKPMSFVHYLVFQNNNIEAVGEEYYVDIEIDREFTNNMVFDDSVSMVTSTPQSLLSNQQSFSREQQQHRFHSYLESPQSSKHPPNAVRKTSEPDGAAYLSDSQASSRSGRYLRNHDSHPNTLATTIDTYQLHHLSFDTLVDFIRHAATTNCPLISSDEHLVLPYSYAKSMAEWTSWSHGKRKSSEWQRALRLGRLLFDRFQVKRTTRELLDICRHLNLTPIVDQGRYNRDPGATEPLIPGDPNSPYITPLSAYSREYYLPILRERLELLETLDQATVAYYVRYCRFCGSLHLPYDRIDELEVICGERKLLILQETHSTYRELLERSIRQVREENGRARARLFPSNREMSSASTAPMSGVLNSPSPTGDAQSPLSTKLHNQNKLISPAVHSAASLSSNSPSFINVSRNLSSPNVFQNSLSVSEGMQGAPSAMSSTLSFGSPKPTHTPQRRGRPPKLSRNSILSSQLQIVASPFSSPPQILQYSPSPQQQLTTAQIPASQDLENVADILATASTETVSEGFVLPTKEELSEMTQAKFLKLLDKLTPHQISKLPVLPADLLSCMEDRMHCNNGNTKTSPSRPDMDKTATHKTIEELSASSNALGADTATMSITETTSTIVATDSPNITETTATNGIVNHIFSSNGADPPSISAPIPTHHHHERIFTAASLMEHPLRTLPKRKSNPSTTSRIDVSNEDRSEASPSETNLLSLNSKEPRGRIGIWNPAQQDILIAFFAANPELLENGGADTVLPLEVLEALSQASDGINEASLVEGWPSSTLAPSSSPITAVSMGMSSIAPGAMAQLKVSSAAMDVYSPSPMGASVSAPFASPHQQSTGLSNITVSGNASTPQHHHPAMEVSLSSTPVAAAGNMASISVTPHMFSHTSHMPAVPVRRRLDGLYHPIHGDLDFRSSVPPSAELVPALHHQLNLLQLDHPTTDHADMLLLRAMNAFTKRLLFGTVLAHAEEKAHEPAEETKMKVVVPLHVATAIVRDPQRFDFLSDEGLARYTSLEMIEANALNEDPAANDVLAQLEHRLKIHRQMASADAKAHSHPHPRIKEHSHIHSQGQEHHNSSAEESQQNPSESAPTAVTSGAPSE